MVVAGGMHGPSNLTRPVAARVQPRGVGRSRPSALAGLHGHRGGDYPHRVRMAGRERPPPGRGQRGLFAYPAHPTTRPGHRPAETTLLLLHHHALGDEPEASNRPRVLQRSPTDLRRIDDAVLPETTYSGDGKRIVQSSGNAHRSRSSSIPQSRQDAITPSWGIKHGPGDEQYICPQSISDGKNPVWDNLERQ